MSRKVKAIIFIVVGLLMFQPFFWSILVFGSSSHYMTLSSFLMTIGFITGGPIFLFGLITLLTRHTSASSSTTELDIGRIRYAVETDKINKK